MFGFYTAVTVIEIISLITILVIVISDEVLPTKNKNGFLCGFLVLIIVIIFEWLVIYIEKEQLPYVFLNNISMAFVYFASPSILVLQALATDNNENKRFNVLLKVTIFLNFFLPFSSLFTQNMFYYDINNVYNRGERFYLYAIVVCINIFIMHYSAYKLSKRYNNKSRYILLFLSLFLFLGVVTEFMTSNDVLWIVSIFTFTMMYIYYSALLNQRDQLTGLLNRRCFENQLYFLKTEAIILFFDVNKFKNINDTYGHDFGDKCLSIIGASILKVYSKVGICFRIGGDEFCVIMKKDFSKVEEYNNKFHILLDKYVGEINLPTVSIGHSYFSPLTSNIHQVIEEADSRMYELKTDSSNFREE